MFHFTDKIQKRLLPLMYTILRNPNGKMDQPKLIIGVSGISDTKWESDSIPGISLSNLLQSAQQDMIFQKESEFHIKQKKTRKPTILGQQLKQNQGNQSRSNGQIQKKKKILKKQKKKKTKNLTKKTIYIIDFYQKNTS